MGGHAFLTPGHRLTTLQLQQFTQYCISHLDTIFPQMASLRHFETKTSHGDLDLLCAWSDYPADGKPLTGQEKGGEGMEYEATGKGGGRYRELCEEVTRRVGAKVWKRGSVAISLAVPIRLIDEVYAKGLEWLGDMEPFYQVDLILTPVYSFTYNLFHTSFGQVPLLLSSSLHRASKKIQCHPASLCIRHLPYIGLRPITVKLTTDVYELCQWAGLNYDRWLSGFKDEEDLWEWLTTPPGWEKGIKQVRERRIPDEDGETSGSSFDTDNFVKGIGVDDKDGNHVPVLVHAWTQMGKRKVAYEKDWHRDADTIMPRFAAYMCSEGNKWHQPIQKKIRRTSHDKVKDVEKSNVQTSSELKPQSIPKVNNSQNIVSSTGACGADVVESVEQQQEVAITTVDESQKKEEARNASLVDPDSPAPLDRHVLSALAYFGKQEVYDLELEDRCQKAKVLAGQQQERVSRREKHQADVLSQSTRSPGAISAGPVDSDPAREEMEASTSSQDGMTETKATESSEGVTSEQESDRDDTVIREGEDKKESKEQVSEEEMEIVQSRVGAMLSP
ncbi:hypothetical protein TREMEDRAFT_73167 [Tremella mesenterica DSM 1558]|uniref:uncharacterized protein n=1 Tax=Tremella mesenterica (strain ATCC 24925 / CBS 8224 / DSM 1558 / NBRC 9311 / NRRL Y-6157 / RJB 2259-6 / UBC 559-6) TaxID=578456 RepID=UPI0003F49BAF|nr:uncharacterized protein TREMEDRAFT_73167 [Tremella mesenterica DSM 1558]EIW71042.1 hypothetical protein TREMEDRAFT_73167 [Tremella mesenterica DSM 1558]